MLLNGPVRVFLVLFLIGTIGCAQHRAVVGRALPPAPARAVTPAPSDVPPESSAASGSLWQGESAYNNFFVDNKARTVNDIVTIEIVESSTASKKATTKLGRSSEISAAAPHLFGLETKLDAKLSQAEADNAAGATKAAIDLANILSATTQNDFDGSGVTTRTGELSGKMTALVTDVLPNGNLRIEGRRVVTVNGEEQIMILTGIIRPEDISSQNIVLSTYIADAAISYYGMGVVAEKQRPGWLARKFDRYWPF